jgi:hypothetical protein
VHWEPSLVHWEPTLVHWEPAHHAKAEVRCRQPELWVTEHAINMRLYAGDATAFVDLCICFAEGVS